jgi:hypothetical protein
MVHLAAGAILAGQLLVSAKSPAFVPAIVKLEMFRFAVPVLVSVTFLAALVVLITWSPNDIEAGETLAPGPMPVPLSETVCMLPANPLLLSAMVRVPVRVPVAVGEKVTLIVQELLAATLPAQVLVSP